MCGQQPVNVSVLLDSLMLVSILSYYLGLCFVLCRNAANLLTLVMFLLQFMPIHKEGYLSQCCGELLLCAIIFVEIFLEIMK